MDKNIVIFSRKAELNEHRNDHQVSTAKKFSNHPSVYVVEDLDSLAVSLSDIKAMKVGSGTRFKSDASIKLNKFLVGSVNDWF
jgi:UDP-N-acetylglucosamine transferase subunit ALG13